MEKLETTVCTSLKVQIPTVKMFWPLVNNNVTLIKWKHAVNNQSLLTDALQSANIHMIEADVGVNSTDSIPIMVHPPDKTSNLTLEQFITKVIEHNKNVNTNINGNNGNNGTRKGIKLDFKTLEAFKISIPILKNHYDSINCPVWLNADVLQGPDAKTGTEVNFDQFLEEAHQLSSNFTLSLGWTTKNGSLDKNSTAQYTEENVNNMLTKISSKNVNNTLTYAVRAGIVTNSKVELMEKLANKASLTIWSAKDDEVDGEKLSNIIKKVGESKVFVDVPAELEAKLHLSGSGNIRTSAIGVMSSILFGFFMSRILSK